MIVGNRIQALADLQATHDEVHAHENAHAAEAGDLALSGPVITDTVTGPDGKEYARGGHVLLDTSVTGDPVEDKRRGGLMIRGAEAPLQVGSALSDSDIRIAAKGRQVEAEADRKIGLLGLLKTMVGGQPREFPLGQLQAMAAGLGLDIPPGRLFSALA